MNIPLFTEVLQLREGRFVAQEPHVERMRKTAAHFFGHPLEVELSAHPIPADLSTGRVKCRILYGRTIESVTFSNYVPRNIRKLAVVSDGTLLYDYKYEDRSSFNNLLSRKGDCDDILIVKNGFVTDTSFTNVVFEESDGTLITPDTPLLAGTRRQALLDEGRIRARPVRAEEITRFQGCYLINAMLGLEDNVFCSRFAIV